MPLRAHLRKIAHAAQQTIRHARRPPATARNFRRARLVHGNSQNPRRPLHDQQQILRRIKFQPVHDPESRTQRRHNQPRARRRPNQRELIQLIRVHARPRPLPDNQIHAKILHRRIQNLLQRRLQSVNLIQKEKILRLQRSEHRGQVTFFLQQRPRADLDRRSHLIRQNLRQRRLAQPRRPVQQHMIQRLTPRARCFHRNLQIFFHPILPDVIGKLLRANAGLYARILIERLPRNNSFSTVRHLSCHLIFFVAARRRHRAVTCRSSRRACTITLVLHHSPPARCDFFITAPPSTCSEARSNVSKSFPTVARDCAMAFSTSLSSYPRFSSADATSASSCERVAGFPASGTSTAASLSRNSTTMRSAVLRPTPGMRTSCARSPLRIAGTSSSKLIPERIFNANEGPTPEAEISSSKQCFSRAV